MSTAAAWGPHGDGPGQCPAPGGSASVASWQAPPLDQGGGAGLRERINFLTGIALASPLSSPEQPVGQVWYRGLAHQKPDGRSPPRLIIAPAVFAATGGTNSATVSHQVRLFCQLRPPACKVRPIVNVLTRGSPSGAWRKAFCSRLNDHVAVPSCSRWGVRAHSARMRCCASAP